MEWYAHRGSFCAFVFLERTVQPASPYSRTRLLRLPDIPKSDPVKKGGNDHMAKKIATIPFSRTAEQEQELRATIDALRDDPGCLMPVMQKA